MRRIAICVAAAAFAFLTPTATAHDGPHGGPDEVTFRVDKKGQINLRQDVKFGTFLVKRARYVVEHRVDADRHTIVLSEVPRKDGRAPAVYELPTQILTGRQVSRRTALYAKELPHRSLVITMVEVAGEQSEHLPQT